MSNDTRRQDTNGTGGGTADTTAQTELTWLLSQDEYAGKGPEEDRAFFARFPHRKYRVRPATPNEIATLEVFGDIRPLRGDAFHWAVIKQVRPGARLRFIVDATAPAFPISERVARRWFRTAAKRGA